MKSIPALLPLLPLVLLSAAAGPCTDQNLGTVGAETADAGPDSGAGAGIDATSACIPLANVTANECPATWTAALADQTAFCAKAQPDFDAFVSTAACGGLLRYTRHLFDAGPRYCTYDPTTHALRGYRAFDGKALFQAISCGSTSADFDDTGCAGTSCPAMDTRTCAVDNDCVGSVYDRPVASPADCYCNNGCGGTVNRTSAQAFEAQWQRFCAGRQMECLAPGCPPPPPVGCEAQQCRGLEPSLTTGTQACDPLAPHTLPIALDTVLGVGKHADGTLYVLEQHAGSELRAFVSASGTLQRKRVGGSGETNDPGRTTYVVTAGEAPDLFTLQVEIATGGDKRMAVLRGASAGKGFTIGQQGDILTVLAPESLTGVPLANLPGTTVIEYQAQLQDGRRMLVTRPQDDWTYNDFRLFLGAPAQVAERRVTNVSRARSGPTTITFLLDMQAADVHFDSPALAPGDLPWIKISNVMSPLTVLPNTTPLTPLSFLCR